MSDGGSETIYLLCPAGTRTGGPEALHQLGRVLIDLGHDARMVYCPPEQLAPQAGDGVLAFPDIADPMPADYAVYAVPRDTTIVDRPGNRVVFPEIWPAIIPLLKHATPCWWWLSIDNGRPAMERFGGMDAVRAARGVVHLCQSYYALSWLAERDVLGLPLFDYISPRYRELAQSPPAPRTDRIVYSSKGSWFCGHLRRWAPGLQWQELRGFSTQEVQELFRTSRLYVDFGAHPGKDRMPREAAMLGCCVITGQRGAAGNPFDVPILARYKFPDSRLAIPRVLLGIRATLADYDQRVRDFDTYRTIIAGEHGEFMAQAARVFGQRTARPQGGGTLGSAARA